MMRLAAVMVVVALVACTGIAPLVVTAWTSPPGAPPIPGRAPGALRVMSYNVNFGGAGDPETIAAIARAAPDIVLLQETNDRWEAALLTALPQYPHHRFTPPRTRWRAGGMGVLSRYPITTLEELPSINGPFFAWRLVFDTPEGPIQVLHVHLRPAISDGGSWVVGYFSTRDDRERELAWHLARLDPTLPTLLAGDFNEELDGHAMRLAARLGYTDAVAPFEGGKRTWEWPVGPFTLRFQLDHLLHDAHFEPNAAGVVGAGRSDHKAIWADLARVTP